MKRLLLSIQYSYCRTQAYLASQRGDGITAVNFMQRAYELDRQLTIESLQS